MYIFRFCGVRSRPYLSPTFNFEASFTTDTNNTDIGFNITVTPMKSPCHKVIVLSLSQYPFNVNEQKNQLTALQYKETSIIVFLACLFSSLFLFVFDSNDKLIFFLHLLDARDSVTFGLLTVNTFI